MGDALWAQVWLFTGFAPGVGDAEAEVEVREGHGVEVLVGKAELAEGHFEGFEGVFLALA